MIKAVFSDIPDTADRMLSADREVLILLEKDARR
jgi:hypothetical protein